ncbi:MAG: hypothetical protein NVS1B9_00590 [Solirubrobacteraceae bacterium]
MDPFESITVAKRTRLRLRAASWLAEHPGRAGEVRFKGVGIVVTREESCSALSSERS